MRKGLVLAIAAGLIVIVAAGAHAQSRTTLGPMIGLNIATWGGSDAGSVGSRTGFLVGGFLSRSLGTLLWIRPEVALTQKGWQESQQGVTVKFKTDYVEMPLLVGLTIPVQGSGIHPLIYGGPAIAINLSCQLSGEQGGSSAEIDCDSPLIGDVLGEAIDIKAVDFGLVLGGGLGFAVGPGQLGVGVRYNLGLAKVVDVTGNPDVKNRVLSVIAEFGFPLGR